MANGEKVVSVSTAEEQGGITATIVTDQGNVYWGRSHPSDNWGRSVSEERALSEATKKMNR